MNKYKVLVLLLFLTFLFSFSKVYGHINELPLLGKVIYVDPGHGGVDPGAVYKEIYEKDINLLISKYLEEELISKGAIVYIIRDGDYDLSKPNTSMRKRSDLSKRVELINKSMCDMYISIHLNMYKSEKWQGAQVFYKDINPKNKEIAKVMQDTLKRTLGTKRNIKEINGMYLYDRAIRPGVLIEVGFLSNANERYLLRQKYYQKKLAVVITEGTINYFNQ